MKLFVCLCSVILTSAQYTAKMVITYGTPTSSTTSTGETSVDWSTCIQNCLSLDTCAMVYRSGDGTKLCVSYPYGDIQSVPYSDESVNDRVGLKVWLDSDGVCQEDVATMFAAKFNLYQDNSSHTYRIAANNDTSSFTVKMNKFEFLKLLAWLTIDLEFENVFEARNIHYKCPLVHKRLKKSVKKLTEKTILIGVVTMFKMPSTSPPTSSASPPGAEEEFEPYVRRKRSEGGNRKKMQGLNEQEQNLLRNSINSRERRRMHELNDEFEALRECLPYPNEANSRRMSKANTLLLASNWIKHLTNDKHKLTNELKAAYAQIEMLSAQLQQNRASLPSVPATSSSVSGSKCSKCQQNACFSVDCITSS
ncbi:unnamed protein product [Caenorhabditis sp. 36 PRJEB53466]|nr:unnamed protein product [Caenorhabditis sp. 36 PRJEB53466]